MIIKLEKSIATEHIINISCIEFQRNILTLWHVDSLLRKDRETN
jgi:hypothetical protein